MASNPMNAVLRRLRRAVSPAENAVQTDAELLAAYASGQAEAFEQLVRRHGRMVLGVCRRVLGNDHDADDAFQATFLVLVRKAGSLTWHDSIANWLYGVACRTARKARLSAARRRRREEVVAAMTREPVTADAADADLKPILDEEVGRLPDKFRKPIVLCYLEGQTNEEAARQLRCPAGTLKVHLMRARDLLRSRLARRGLTVSAVTLAALLDAQAASASVPESLLGATLNAAERFAAGSAAGASGATALAEGVLHDMFLAKVKNAALTLAGVVAIGLGIGLSISRADKAEGAAAAETAAPAEARRERPAVKAEDTATLVKGGNAFAFQMYAQLRGENKGNLFFSPYSVSTALAMTYGGARGDTADEMAKAMHFTLPQDRLHPAAGAQIDSFNGAGTKRPYRLAVANALWGQQQYPFEPKFVQLNKDAYGAGLNLLDFSRDPQACRETINHWVEDKTEHKITKLLPPSAITANTKLVLTNAIYFKGDWARKFIKDDTKDADFFVTADRKVRVPLMHQEGSFRMMGTGKYQALELPYAGKELSMLVLLPRKLDGLGELEKSLTPALLDETVLKLTEQDEVQVRLPRFKMLFEADLVPPLKNLGMKKAFVPGADFSGISQASELRITGVFHKAFVEVNEEGTEAAAATAVAMADGGVEQVPIFRADHPFLFLIRDNRSGAILFLGSVTSPAE